MHSCLYCGDVLEENNLNGVNGVGICIRGYFTWAGYVSITEDYDKPDEWSNNKLCEDNRGICFMLATNPS